MSPIRSPIIPETDRTHRSVLKMNRSECDGVTWRLVAAAQRHRRSVAGRAGRSCGFRRSLCSISSTWWHLRTVLTLATQPAARYYIRKHKEQKPRGRTDAKPAAARPPEVHDTCVWVGPSFCCVHSSRQVKD